MIVSEALLDIRNRTNDKDEVGMNDSELLSYLNDAIQYVSQHMIGADAPVMVQDLLVEDEETTSIPLPKNFIRFCGTFPVKVTGNNITLLVTPPIKLRYFASYPTVKINDTMPFQHDQLNQIAVRLAVIYVNNQEELNVQQDQGILTEINNSIIAALKRG